MYGEGCIAFVVLATLHSPCPAIPHSFPHCASSLARAASDTAAHHHSASTASTLWFAASLIAPRLEAPCAVMFPSALTRICRSRPRLPFPQSSFRHSIFPLNTSSRTFASHSSRLPDSFDDIEDRDAHLQPALQRGLTAHEFAQLPEDEQETIRQRERDIMNIEDEMADQRLEAIEDPDDDYILGPADSTTEPLELTVDSPGNYRTAHPDQPLSWMLVQTDNPELIAPLPGSDPTRPTTVRYPFIPVLAGERMIREASVLHRWLQYNRLRNTKQFLAIERKRRQLERQREYRDLTQHTQAAIAKLPTGGAAKAAAAVKNAPANVSREHFERNSPLSFDMSTEWMADVLRDMEAELRMNGAMSTAEKEAVINECARVMKWAYKRMEKDKKAGYYRVMAEAGLSSKGASEQKRPPVPTRQLSSALRSGRVHGESAPQ